MVAHSREYLKRRNQLIIARISLVTLVSISVVTLVGFSLVEGWALRTLLSHVLTGGELAFIGTLTAIFLAVYCVVLSRLALHISYHLERAAVAKTVVTAFCVLVYGVFLFRRGSPQPVMFLAVSKLFAIFLCFRFWHSQLNETRLKLHSKVLPKIYIISWNAFFICRWVIAACWLLVGLGFALALVSTHPIIDMEGWEGITLLGTFYLVFRAFVRNPNAHAGYTSSSLRNSYD